jgi:hypothetical protein
MAFMIPEYTKEPFWIVETNAGTEKVPADLLGEHPSKDDFSDYVEGTEIYDFQKVTAWFARLSAPGYLDATDWGGPFKTKKDAKEYIEETYDVDPDTGDELEDNPSYDWWGPAQKWLLQEAQKEEQMQLRAHLRRRRKKSTFRYIPPQWHRDAMEALGANDEEWFKAIKLQQIGHPPIGKKKSDRKKRNPKRGGNPTQDDVADTAAWAAVGGGAGGLLAGPLGAAGGAYIAAHEAGARKRFNPRGKLTKAETRAILRRASRGRRR